MDNTTCMKDYLDHRNRIPEIKSTGWTARDILGNNLKCKKLVLVGKFHNVPQDKSE